MRTIQRAALVACAALAVFFVARLALRRPEPPRRPPPPARVVPARDAGVLVAATDLGPTPDVGFYLPPVLRPPRPVPPAQRARENQQRDAVAAQVYRDMLLGDGGVTAVRAVETAGGVRDNLHVEATRCDDAFSRRVARDYPLRRARFGLVTCTHPGTRDTFVTAVPME